MRVKVRVRVGVRVRVRVRVGARVRARARVGVGTTVCCGGARVVYTERPRLSKARVRVRGPRRGSDA